MKSLQLATQPEELDARARMDGDSLDRKARTGRNPATGESIKIPAKKVVKFRVAKAAKDAIVPPKKAK